LTLPFPAAAAILVCVGLATGTLNVLAGGGSLLSLPVLIFLGLPPTVANGTNRVAILVQNIGAVWGFRRHGLIPRGWLRLGVPPSLLGALCGMWVAVQVGDATLQRVLAFLMVAIAVWTIWNPIQPPVNAAAEPPASAVGRAALLVAFFGIGFYGGFIQAGAGFVVLAVLGAAGLDLVRSNALKVTLVLIFTPLALAGFALNGLVDWGLGFSLAIGNFMGALLGVRLNVKKGQTWVRKVMVVAVLGFAIKLWLDAS
jgi:uncharacterized membrane protein YfcA